MDGLMTDRITIEQLEEFMTSKEGEKVRIQGSQKGYHFDKLVKYCAALANEGGGIIVLRVTDKRPRKVVGSQSFQATGTYKGGSYRTITSEY